jgi:hypothetical protein
MGTYLVGLSLDSEYVFLEGGIIIYTRLLLEERELILVHRIIIRIRRPQQECGNSDFGHNCTGGWYVRVGALEQ